MKLIRKILAAGFCLCSGLGLLVMPVQSKNTQVLDAVFEAAPGVTIDPVNSENIEEENKEIHVHDEEKALEEEEQYASGEYRPASEWSEDYDRYSGSESDLSSQENLDADAQAQNSRNSKSRNLETDEQNRGLDSSGTGTSDVQTSDSRSNENQDADSENSDRSAHADESQPDAGVQSRVMEADPEADEEQYAAGKARSILEAPVAENTDQLESEFSGKVGSKMAEQEAKNNPLMVPAAIMAVVEEDAQVLEEKRIEEERIAKEKAEEEERLRKEEEEKQRLVNATRFHWEPDFNNLEVWQNPESPYHKARLWGQCTWFAWHRFYEIYGFNPGFRNRGAVVAYQLQAAHPDKFELSKTPKAGAIFSYENHTGIVLQVNDDGTMIFQDGNYDGVTNHDWNTAINDWKTVTIDIDEFMNRYPGAIFANPTFTEVLPY